MKFLLWFMIGIDVGWLIYFLCFVIYGFYKLILLVWNKIVNEI